MKEYELINIFSLLCSVKKSMSTSHLCFHRSSTLIIYYLPVVHLELEDDNNIDPNYITIDFGLKMDSFF